MADIGSPRVVVRKYWWLILIAIGSGVIIGLLLEGMLRSIARQGITIYSVFPGIFAIVMLGCLGYAYYKIVSPAKNRTAYFRS